jgi:hypothetical protein
VVWDFLNTVTREQLGGTSSAVKFRTARFTRIDGPHTAERWEGQHLRVMAKGGGGYGGLGSTYGFGVRVEKENWDNAATVQDGEVNGIYSSIWNGGAAAGGTMPGYSGGAAYLADASILNDSGSIQVLEGNTFVYDRAVPATKLYDLNVQFGSANTRDDLFYGAILNARVGTATAAIRTASSVGATWSKIIEHYEGSANTFYIDVLGKQRWRVNGSNISVEQDSTTHALGFKNNAGTDVLTITQSSGIDASALSIGGTAIAGSAGSSLVGFIHAGSGAVAWTIQDKLRESVSALDYFSTAQRAAVLSGAAVDMTSAIVTALTNETRLFFPDGHYFIAGAGADAGGVEVSLTHSLHVFCGPKARFYTNSLDNDLIRLAVPSNGVGLPSDGITVDWDGGFFDQRSQKNSTVIPFPTDYPPANPGASSTCDGLSIRGNYNDGSVKNGMSRITVKNAQFVAGTHWNLAGGDSGLFAMGAELIEVFNNRFVGSRDLGFYGSWDDTAGTVGGRINCVGNDFVNCFFGASVKRSAQGFDISRNTFTNCLRAVQAEWTAGSGLRGGSVMFNEVNGCNILYRGTIADEVVVSNNYSTGAAGALMDDGTTAASINQEFVGIQLRGSSRCVVAFNRIVGVNAATTAAFADRAFLKTEAYDPGTGAISCDDNVFLHNLCDSFRTLGADAGNRNSFVENIARNASVSSNLSAVGTNCYEVRVDSSNVRIFNNPVQFNDGSASAVAIARRGGTNTGIFFATNKVAIAVAGTERLGASTTGIAVTGTLTATGAIGYATGAGGTVAQATSKSTGVTLNKVTGEITMDAEALAANTVVSFTLTNSAIAAGDYVQVQHVSAGTAGAYNCTALAAAGSATINVRNLTAGSLSEAIVLKYVVIKAVTA